MFHFIQQTQYYISFEVSYIKHRVICNHILKAFQYIDTINMGPTFGFFKVSRVEILNYAVVLSLKAVLILANSADSDEMQHYVAFHLDLHCLPKYLFRGFQYTKG